MQVQDNNTRLLYGLFQSICGWALENGYRDISTMKNLLKLAMVDVCRKQHSDKATSAMQMSVVADLGISLRNAQYSLKALSQLNELATGFVKIRQIQREILMLLTERPRAFEELLSETSYLIHAPLDLQKRSLRAILKELERKEIIWEDAQDGSRVYRTVEAHVDLFDPTDLASRVSAVLSHIDYFKHTVGKPFFEIYHLTAQQAIGLQQATNELLRGSGNAHELEHREASAVTRPYYFYLGSAPLEPGDRSWRVDEVILEVVHTRFKDVDSPSLAKAHWYHLTRESATLLHEEVRSFIQREGKQASKSAPKDTQPFAFYFGMADRRAGMLREGMQS